jgi:hypothetical protein
MREWKASLWSFLILGCPKSKIRTLKPKIKIILMPAFEIREGELARVLPSIKIDRLISKPISLKSLVEIVKNTI